MLYLLVVCRNARIPRWHFWRRKLWWSVCETDNLPYREDSYFYSHGQGKAFSLKGLARKAAQAIKSINGAAFRFQPFQYHGYLEPAFKNVKAKDRDNLQLLDPAKCEQLRIYFIYNSIELVA